MNVIKRNGDTVHFQKDKIEHAILKAMKYGSGIVKEKIAENIAVDIENYLIDSGKTEVTIKEIESMVFFKLIEKKQKITAKAYESYRSIKEFQRDKYYLDRNIDGIVNGTDKDIIDENSNKNSYIASTQRDLIAGEYSKDYCRRNVLPTNILQAHDNGIIHVHDMDYMIEHIPNCCLINLEDMLQNNTVINGKLIEKPRSFRTACTIATQIIQQVSNGQYGGQTINLAHLSPFVRISYNKYIDIYKQRGFKEDDCIKYANEDLKREIKDGCQTIQYQINTFSSVNG